VHKSRLQPSTQLSEAEWLLKRLHSFSEHRVTSVVPAGFPAYIRILHPAYALSGEPLTWAEIAVRSGRTMHRLVQFHAVAAGSSSGPLRGSVENISPPDNGNLAPDLLSALCEVLSAHTDAEHSCWFCLWDGYGWLHDEPSVADLVFAVPGDSLPDPTSSVPSQVPADVLQAAKLTLPFRNYLLLQGPLDAALELGWNLTPNDFVPQSPNLFWPQDHAWCVASEIDLFCTLVAGSEALAETLIADPRFEALPVSPDDPITYNSDQINT